MQRERLQEERAGPDHLSFLSTEFLSWSSSREGPQLRTHEEQSCSLKSGGCGYGQKSGWTELCQSSKKQPNLRRWSFGSCVGGVYGWRQHKSRRARSKAGWRVTSAGIREPTSWAAQPASRVWQHQQLLRVVATYLDFSKVLYIDQVQFSGLSKASSRLDISLHCDWYSEAPHELF